MCVGPCLAACLFISPCITRHSERRPIQHIGRPHQREGKRRSLLQRPPEQPPLPRQGVLRKLAVINFSGNVGETTVARHLLAPRIPGCQVVAVESINTDDGQPVTIRGRQFAQLQEFLQSVDNVVVDIGASSVEELLRLMRRYQDSQEDFDGFVVPTVPARKQQQDTAATLAEHKAEIAKAAAQPDKLALAQRLAPRRLARGVIPELDACFAALELHRLPSSQQATPTA